MVRYTNHFLSKTLRLYQQPIDQNYFSQTVMGLFVAQLHMFDRFRFQRAQIIPNNQNRRGDTHRPYLMRVLDVGLKYR